MNVLPNWVDLIVLIFVFRACYVGLERGALSALLTLIGAVSATSLTINAADAVWKVVQPWSPIGNMVGRVVAFWALFVILLMLVRMMIRRVTGVISGERIHWFLQAVGLVLGAARGMWWAAFLILAFVSSGVPYLYNSTAERSLIVAQLVNTSQEIVTEVSGRFPGASGRSETLIPSLLTEEPLATSKDKKRK